MRYCFTEYIPAVRRLEGESPSNDSLLRFYNKKSDCYQQSDKQ
nr:MAG TPA: hypothetical protein [Caudoviricetes sp.]